MSDDSKSLFLEAMQDVTPLKDKALQPQHDQQKNSQASQDVIRKLRKKQRLAEQQYKTENILNRDKFKHCHKVTSFDSLLYNQKGVRLQELSRIKKGDFNVEAVLDLHGLIADEAEQEIIDFISHCYARNQRFIRIIHGKGYNSNEQHPILKNIVNQILREIKEVIAFSSAQEKDGGVGAVNILLRAR